MVHKLCFADMIKKNIVKAIHIKPMCIYLGLNMISESNKYICLFKCKNVWSLFNQKKPHQIKTKETSDLHLWPEG